MTSKSVKVTDGEIFYREATSTSEARRGDVLLLHGMRFSSQNWLELKTLEKLGEWGYRAVAIDLPGFGNSKSTTINCSKSECIHEICEKLSLKKPVIVSPSMSGEFSLPYLIGKYAHLTKEQNRIIYFLEHGGEMSGYIPIAPVTTGSYINEYAEVKVPTFIVYGENDTRLGETSLKHLSHIPNSKILKIENAGHACYLDQPDVWHTNLRQFLDSLNFNP